MPLSIKWIRFGQNEQFSGYFVKPSKDDPAKKRPAILLIQEIWGIDSHIRDVAERFAAAGYAVLAPDLFFKDGIKAPELEEERIEEGKRFIDSMPPAAWRDPVLREAKLSEMPEPQRSLVGDTVGSLFAILSTREVFLPALEAGVRFLRELDSPSEPRKVAALGFCLGGALSVLLAARNDELSSAVVFYGHLPSLDVVPNINCPVQGHFGETDLPITGGVPDFAAAMEKHDKSFEYRIYEDTPHAFFNDTRISYRAEAADESWKKTLAFLERTLG